MEQQNMTAEESQKFLNEEYDKLVQQYGDKAEKAYEDVVKQIADEIGETGEELPVEELINRTKEQLKKEGIIIDAVKSPDMKIKLIDKMLKYAQGFGTITYNVFDLIKGYVYFLSENCNSEQEMKDTFENGNISIGVKSYKKEVAEIFGMKEDINDVTGTDDAPINMRDRLTDIMLMAAEDIGNLTDDVRERIKSYIEFLSNKYGNDEVKMKEVFYNGDEDAPSCTDALEDIFDENASLIAAENDEDPYEIVAAAKEETNLEAAEGTEDETDGEYEKAEKICDDNGNCYYRVHVSDSPDYCVAKCRMCGDLYVFDGISCEEIENSGVTIQELMPNVSPDYREVIVSGTCPTCWKKIFPDEEED